MKHNPQIARLDQIINKFEANLENLHNTKTFLQDTLVALRYVRDGEEAPNGHLSAKARKAISDAQRARWAKSKRKQRKSVGSGDPKNFRMPNWTPADDARIVKLAVSKGEIEAVELVKLIAKKLTNRTTGAIRQRLGRLAKKGALIETKQKDNTRRLIKAA